MNLRPLDEIDHYGLAWTITDLLGFTREDRAVYLGVYRSSTGLWPTIGGRFLAARRIPKRTSARARQQPRLHPDAEQATGGVGIGQRQHRELGDVDRVRDKLL